MTDAPCTTIDELLSLKLVALTVTDAHLLIRGGLPFRPRAGRATPADP